MMTRYRFLALPLAVALLAAGCKKQETQATSAPNSSQQVSGQTAQPTSQPGTQQNAQSAQQQNPQAPQPNGSAQPAGPQGGQQAISGPAVAAGQPAAGTAAPAPVPTKYIIPAGTHITVRLGQTLSSKTSQTGEPFSATVATPVRVDGQEVLRSGDTASGVVTEAKPLGRFKGKAVLAVRLDSIHADSGTYNVSTSTIERVKKGKGKRTAAMIGGGAGLGMLVGGLATGGVGLLVGGLVGAGAGTAGTAFTGNKNLTIPAETLLTFRLERPVTLQ